jgi:hypothetical protein
VARRSRSARPCDPARGWGLSAAYLRTGRRGSAARAGLGAACLGATVIVARGGRRGGAELSLIRVVHVRWVVGKHQGDVLGGAV